MLSHRATTTFRRLLLHHLTHAKPTLTTTIRTFGFSRHNQPVSRHDTSFEPPLFGDDDPFDLSSFDSILQEDDPSKPLNDQTPLDGKLQEEEEQRQEIRDELDSRTGRLWSDPWEITDEDIEAGLRYDDLPDWEEGVVSGLARGFITICDEGVPTLDSLSTLPLPDPAPPHPVHDKALYLQQYQTIEYDRILSSVRSVARHKIEAIWNIPMEERQDAVDELFESVEGDMMEREGVRLGDRRAFGSLVETALEEFLVEMNETKREEVEREERMVEGLKDEEEGYESDSSSSSSSSSDEDSDDDDDDIDSEDNDEEAEPFSKQPQLQNFKSQLRELDKTATPLFMDLKQISPQLTTINNNDTESSSEDDPNDWYAISGAAGGMTEEWELAAHKTTQRIMLRRCMRDVAQLLMESGENGTRILLDGRKGTGKSAALNAIVASARRSDTIVLFFPDGDLMTQRGKYIEPSQVLEGKYILPVMAQDACRQLLTHHMHQLRDMTVPIDRVRQFCTKEQFQKLNLEEGSTQDVELVHLLEMGSQLPVVSSSAYDLVMHHLINEQTLYKFVMVVDELNAYYDKGHYYHESFDYWVNKTIPQHQITLFEPFLNPSPKLKFVGAITHSRPIKRDVASRLVTEWKEDEERNVVEVLPYSELELRTILAHFEAVGIGRLRFDRGKTLGDGQEVNFLGMLSGGIGRYLLDGCII